MDDEVLLLLLLPPSLSLSLFYIYVAAPFSFILFLSLLYICTLLPFEIKRCKKVYELKQGGRKKRKHSWLYVDTLSKVFPIEKRFLKFSKIYIKS